MRGLNCGGEVPISFVPDGLVKGTRKKKMWAVVANGRPVARRENSQFPIIDNTRALFFLHEAEQWELRRQQLED